MPVIAAYPNSVPSFTTKADDVDTVFADHINVLQAEVAAIAATLGTLPAASYGSVKARIAAVEASAAAIAAHFDSGGLIPQAGVVDLVASLAALTASVSAAQTFTSAAGAAWADYTPAVTANTTNPVFPAGVLKGRFLQVGKTLSVCVNVLGGPTNAGSGVYSFGLPPGVLAAGLVQTGAVITSDGGGSTRTGSAELHPTNASFQVRRDDTTLITHVNAPTLLYASLEVEVA